MANFLCWNFGGRKIFFRGVFGKENVTIWGGFTRINQENCLKIYSNSYSSRTCRIWADNNQLGLRPRWLYVSYPARPRRITVNYYNTVMVIIHFYSSVKVTRFRVRVVCWLWSCQGWLEFVASLLCYVRFLSQYLGCPLFTPNFKKQTNKQKETKKNKATTTNVM